MEKKSFWWWIVFILLVIWQLPQFIVAVVMLPFLGKMKLVGDRHFNFCFVADRMAGGISLGPFAYVSKAIDRYDRREETIAHELDGHTVDSKIWGPLYLFVVGIPSILNAQFDFTKCYYDFYTERWANNHAGLTTDEKCNLVFKKDVQVS
jgi:hypothetical protein